MVQLLWKNSLAVSWKFKHSLSHIIYTYTVCYLLTRIKNYIQTPKLNKDMYLKGMRGYADVHTHTHTQNFPSTGKFHLEIVLNFHLGNHCSNMCLSREDLLCRVFTGVS